MNNSNYRLQILNHKDLFPTRDEAIGYINDNFRMEALVGEPAIAYYGDSDEPNAIIALGTPTSKRVFFIDTFELSQSLKELKENSSEELEKDRLDIDDLIDKVSNIITAAGFIYDDNKKSNRITYEPDNKDSVIGETKTLAEAVAKLSEYAQKHVADNALTVKDTNTVAISYKDTENGKEMSADVKLSIEGADDDLAFNNNIIGVKPDGLFAAVSLAFDENRRELIFTTSGIKNDVFVTDAKVEKINIGEHTGVVAQNEDANPIKVTVEDDGNGNKVISSKALLSEDPNNIIKVQDGALLVDGRAKNIKYKEASVFDGIVNLEDKVEVLSTFDVEVDVAKNSLTITVGEHTETVMLPGVDIIDNVKYDKVNHQIIITFKNGSSATIPLDDIFKGYYFDTTGTIELHEHVNEDGSATITTAVKLRDTDNAIAIDENGYMYVPVSKTAAEIDTIVESIRSEIERAKSAEQALRDGLTKEIHDRETSIAETKLYADSVVKGEHDRALEAENKLQEKIDAETNTRVSEITRVETEVVGDAKAEVLENLQNEIDRAKGAEQVNAKSIADETARAIQAETVLTSDVDTIKDKLKIHGDSLTSLSDKIAEETTRATGKEHALELVINENKQKIDKEIANRVEKDASQDVAIQSNHDALITLQGTVDTEGSIRSIINDELVTTNNKIDNETERAETAEGVLGERIDALVTANGNTLKDSKAYTDEKISDVKGITDSIKVDIKALQDKDTEIKGILDTKVEAVRLEGVEGQPLTYQLLVKLPTGEAVCGTINIPQDNFFKSAHFDEATGHLFLTFSTPDGEQVADLNMNSLVQIYHAGNGLGKDSDNKFFINKNEDGDEGYLVVNENGICIQGINAKLSEKANVGDSYTKTESETTYSDIRQEITTAKNDLTLVIKDAKTELNGKVTEVANSVTVETNRASLEENRLSDLITANTSAITNNNTQTNAKLAELTTKASNNTTAITAEETRATAAEKALDVRVTAAEDKINTLNAGVGVEGSVSDKISKAQSAINDRIVQVEKDYANADTVLNNNITNLETNLTHQIDDAKTECNTYTDNAVRTVADRVTTNENAITAINDSIQEVKESVKQSEITVETKTANSPVNLTKDKNVLGVQLTISSATDNLLSTNDGGLFASSNALYHTCLGENNQPSTVQGELNKIYPTVRDAKTAIEEVRGLQTNVNTISDKLALTEEKVQTNTDNINAINEAINNASFLKGGSTKTVVVKVAKNAAEAEYAVTADVKISTDAENELIQKENGLYCTTRVCNTPENLIKKQSDGIFASNNAKDIRIIYNGVDTNVQEGFKQLTDKVNKIVMPSETIESLNATVVEQQKQIAAQADRITQLETLVNNLVDKVNNLIDFGTYSVTNEHS